VKQRTDPRTIQRASSARISIITAITSYLGFFVLLVLVVETVLGAIALKNEGQSQLVALYGFLAVVILMIVVVSFLAYFSPATLTSASLQQLHDFGGRISGSWWEFRNPRRAFGRQLGRNIRRCGDRPCEHQRYRLRQRRSGRCVLGNGRDLCQPRARQGLLLLEGFASGASKRTLRRLWRNIV
jgi:hypothetical protein